MKELSLKEDQIYSRSNKLFDLALLGKEMLSLNPCSNDLSFNPISLAENLLSYCSSECLTVQISSSETELYRFLTRKIFRKIGQRRSCDKNGDYDFYYLIEVTRPDLDVLGKVTDNPLASYGVDEEEFLRSEIIRLDKQQAIGAKYILSKIGDDLANAKNVLDLGCGTGNMLAMIKDHYPSINCTGVDLEKTFIEHAKKKYPNINFIHGDFFQEISNLESIDIVICRFVTQHIGLNRSLELLDLLQKFHEGAKIIFYDSDDSLFFMSPYDEESKLLLESTNRSQFIYGGDRYTILKLYTEIIKMGKGVEDFSIDYWDTRNIPYQELLNLLKPVFFDKNHSSFLSLDSLSKLQSKMKNADPEVQYCRGGLVFLKVEM